MPVKLYGGPMDGLWVWLVAGSSQLSAGTSPGYYAPCAEWAGVWVWHWKRAVIPG